MAKTKEKVLCSNCGAPFHGLTTCPEDAPNFIRARKAQPVTVKFEMTAEDLETLVFLIHNNIMDLEDNGNDGDPEAAILRAFVKQIEGRY